MLGLLQVRADMPEQQLQYETDNDLPLIEGDTVYHVSDPDTSGTVEKACVTLFSDVKYLVKFPAGSEYYYREDLIKEQK